MSIAEHLRILRPRPGVLAFYDGRIEGQRFAPGANWVDDGALSLGIASYAVVSGDQALVYDTHVSLDHARAVRHAVEAEGARQITVVLSHCHLDHVAGTEVFADCEVIACRKTYDHLSRDRHAIEQGKLSGGPAISPLILPTKVFDGEMRLLIGDTEVVLIEANIHSDDAVVLWLPQTRVLIAGDTVEDSVTYVGEPESFALHLADIERLFVLEPSKVLPNHGAPEVIAKGGYDASLLTATADYIRWLMRLWDQPELAQMRLAEAIAPQLEAGSLTLWPPYEDVHRQNIKRTLAAGCG
ncbi:MAG: MBL fold metallo-hydrolase [Cereibacter sphaeroides]|uniref:MBL fold metallo-hydrolase n=1 Tax=Cereibacter sphaeroides TaxID=1063 RepID=A0A2W5SAB6_CERSP|nr:MAG: MBL fold metallo-hydrolase [Cereibacter sphaeroides]